ncbi:MAG: hypothetical protein J6I47_02635 [Ruminococcus sp.]|nr:hypothetical protein [Ruminococcus sp.]
MKVMLITSNHAPEVVELVDTEDKLRQCAARLRCPTDSLNVRTEEINEVMVSVLTPPETEDAPITGTDYETGEPVVKGSFIICRYDDKTGLMRDIKDEDIVRICSGFNGSAITTFNAAHVYRRQRREESAKFANSPEGLRRTAAFYADIINGLRYKYADTYANNSDGRGQIYKDILRDNPEIVDFIKQNPTYMPAYAKYLDRSVFLEGKV